MRSRRCWWSTTAHAAGRRCRPPEPAEPLRTVAFPPLLIEHPQGSPVGDVLPAVEQGGDALGVDLQGGHLLPEPFGHRLVRQLKLRRRQLAHQQEHQLLFLAFGEGSLEPLVCVDLSSCLFHRFCLQLVD
ncbi:MAG: hypothetical protein EBR33_12065 [Synechococcaceae bacterium WB4_1_0192]|nr:hypothetical protein [Synechococcaceae bacterium WB4_1_0192]